MVESRQQFSGGGSGGGAGSSLASAGRRIGATSGSGTRKQLVYSPRHSTTSSVPFSNT
jgi:hypothetical protein